jgi:hypothetical protein
MPLKRSTLTLVRVFAAMALSVAALGAPQKNSLSNADVVKMVKAGLAETTIVAAIAANDTQFDLSSSGLQSLNQAGVSSRIIRAMLAADAKKKNAAAAPAQDATAAQDSPPGASPGASPQAMTSPQMSQMGISPEMMAQMANNLPPEARARMEKAMARNAAGRSGAGGPPASVSNSLPVHAGVPVPLDSPLYTSFSQLQTRPAYRVVMTMMSNDPRLAQMQAQGLGLSPSELVVQGATRQVVMHMRMPATDLPGTIDDWEIRSVVRNGRAARLITSPSVPRYLKRSEESVAMQLAMLDQQASTAIARAAAEGPMGAITAGLDAAELAVAHVEAHRLLKRAKDMFSWQCQAAPKAAQPGSSQGSTQLTDLHPVGDETVEGKAASAYEFYAYDSERTQGTVHMLIAKDTGLPLRLSLSDPQSRGAIQMDYAELDREVQIEIPPCMADAP